MIEPPCEESNNRSNWDNINYQSFDPTDGVIANSNSYSQRSQSSESQLGTPVKTLCDGGCVGICLALGTVCAASTINLSLHHTLLLGFSILSVIAVCLAITEFISFRAQNMYMLNEYLYHQNQLETRRDVSLASVVHILTSKGVTLEDAEFTVQVLSKYEEFFLEDIFIPLKSQHVMMIPAHRLYEIESLLGEAVLTFFSVLVIGSIPLISLLAANSTPRDEEDKMEDEILNYTVFFVTSAAGLLTLGSLKNWYYGIGCCSGATSYVVIGIACALAGALPGSAST